MPTDGSDDRSSFPETENEAILRVEILNILCNLGHTNPTNISVEQLSDNHFPTHSDEDLIRSCIDQMVENGDPIEYADRREETVHVTNSTVAGEIYQETMADIYNL